MGPDVERYGNETRETHFLPDNKHILTEDLCVTIERLEGDNFKVSFNNDMEGGVEDRVFKIDEGDTLSVIIPILHHNYLSHHNLRKRWLKI
ncbi:MAG: hypothetical protein KAS32_23955 [Candidatus Peribacteraceae bacterium]|nr:hypothetical protein [Candidatus Peribacteraceae bacterium]